MERRRRWFEPMFLFFALFCVAWNAFLAFWCSMAFWGGAPWIMVVSPIVHVAVGVGLTDSTLAGLFNTTAIGVERRALVVSHAPIPWRGPGAIESARVEQLYVKCEERRGKHGVNYRYSVWLVLSDKRSTPLVKGMGDPAPALYIEQQIERDEASDASRPTTGRSCSSARRSESCCWAV